MFDVFFCGKKFAVTYKMKDFRSSKEDVCYAQIFLRLTLFFLFPGLYCNSRIILSYHVAVQRSRESRVWI